MGQVLRKRLGGTKRKERKRSAKDHLGDLMREQAGAIDSMERIEFFLNGHTKMSAAGVVLSMPREGRKRAARTIAALRERIALREEQIGFWSKATKGSKA